MSDQFVLMMIGLSAYMLFYIFKLPTPAMLGPMFVIMILSRFGFSPANIDSYLLFLLQTILGIYIGIEIKKENITFIKKLYMPAASAVVWTFLITFGLGVVLIRVADIDPVTAFLSTSPAGITEMSMLAFSVGADVTTVSVFQLSRSLITLTAFPFVIRRIQKKKEHHRYTSEIIRRVINVIRVLPTLWMSISYSRSRDFRFLFTVIAGMVGAYAGRYYSIPGGAMIGSFIFIALISLTGVPLKAPPRIFRTLIQIGVGLNIGISFVKTEHLDLGKHIWLVVIFVLVIFSSAYLMSRLLKKITGWDELTCILATAPAGITPMTIIAYENNCKALEVSMLQLTRLLTVKVVIWPIVLLLLQ